MSVVTNSSNSGALAVANEQEDPLLVSIEPSTSIHFDRPDESAAASLTDSVVSSSATSPTAFIKIANRLTTEAILFRIQTTSPLSYRVRPSHGRIPPGENMEIQVMMVAESKKHDKFLIKYAPISNQATGEFAELFEMVESIARQHRLRCVINNGSSWPSSGLVAAAGGKTAEGPAGAQGSAIASTPNDLPGGLHSTNVTANSASSIASFANASTDGDREQRTSRILDDAINSTINSAAALQKLPASASQQAQGAVAGNSATSLASLTTGATALTEKVPAPIAASAQKVPLVQQPAMAHQSQAKEQPAPAVTAATSTATAANPASSAAASPPAAAPAISNGNGSSAVAATAPSTGASLSQEALVRELKEARSQIQQLATRNQELSQRISASLDQQQSGGVRQRNLSKTGSSVNILHASGLDFQRIISSSGLPSNVSAAINSVIAALNAQAGVPPVLVILLVLFSFLVGLLF